MIEGKRVTTTNKGRRFRRFSFDRNDEAKQNLGDGELLWQLVVLLLLLFVINVCFARNMIMTNYLTHIYCNQSPRNHSLLHSHRIS